MWELRLCLVSQGDLRMTAHVPLKKRYHFYYRNAKNADLACILEHVQFKHNGIYTPKENMNLFIFAQYYFF